MTSHGIRVNERTGQSLRQIHGFQIGATSYFHYNGLGGRLGFRQQSDLLMPDTALPAPQLMATLGTTKKSRLAVSFKQYFEKQNRAAKSSKDLQKAASSESDAVAFALGNPSSPGGPARWSYAWDVAGRLASVTYPRRDEGFATQATYQYQAGFLTSIDASFQDPFAPGFVGSVSASLAYDAPGWVRDTAVSTSARSGEVLHVTSARDGSGLPRPASWGVSHRDLDPNVSPLIALETRTYSYDPLGNVIGIASSRGFPVSYRYDTRSRLIQDEIAGRMVLTESREYDGFGNLVKVNNDALGTNKGTNRLLTRASYDSAGRMIEDEALNVGRDYYPDGALMAEFAHPEGSVETLAPNGASIWLMNGSAENVLSFWGDATYCQTEQFRSLVRDESAKLLTEYRGETEAPCVCDTPCVFRDRFYRDIVRLGPWATASYTRGVGIKLEALDHLGTPRYVTTASGTSPSFVLLDSFGAQISGTPATRELFTGHERNHTSDQAVSLPISDYMHARTYVPMLGRFTRPDPANSFSLFNPQSLNRYAYAHNNPVNLIDPDGKDAIPVVFPDYRVALPTGGRYPFGHAGIILIDNKTGSTRYYEYGRYSPRGSVRQVGVPDVKMGADGFPTKESLKRLFNAVRKESGQGGRLEGAYVKDDNFAAMVEYAEGREAQNEDPSRKKYGFLTNNCMTFAQDVLESGGMNTPLMIDPSPKSYIKELQESASDKGTTGDGVARVVKVCDNNGCHFAIR